MKRTVLSVDGGGIRGAAAAGFLARLEASLGRSLYDTFDLFAGTSTGGIIACALGVLKMDGQKLANLYNHENGNEIKVEKYQGVMIPKGAYYRYHNTGKENLVVIRVGAGIKGQKQGGEEMRIRPDGKPLPAYSAENKTVEPIEDTRFFADSAG